MEGQPRHLGEVGPGCPRELPSRFNGGGIETGVGITITITIRIGEESCACNRRNAAAPAALGRLPPSLPGERR